MTPDLTTRSYVARSSNTMSRAIMKGPTFFARDPRGGDAPLADRTRGLDPRLVRPREGSAATDACGALVDLLICRPARVRDPSQPRPAERGAAFGSGRFTCYGE